MSFLPPQDLVEVPLELLILIKAISFTFVVIPAFMIQRIFSKLLRLIAVYRGFYAKNN
jgi:hypothetical protein